MKFQVSLPVRGTVTFSVEACYAHHARARVASLPDPTALDPDLTLPGRLFPFAHVELRGHNG